MARVKTKREYIPSERSCCLSLFVYEIFALDFCLSFSLLLVFYLYAVFGMVQCNLDTPFNCNWNKFITIRKWKCQHRATIPANCQWKWGDKWQSATLNRRASTHQPAQVHIFQSMNIVLNKMHIFFLFVGFCNRIHLYFGWCQQRIAGKAWTDWNLRQNWQ